MLHTMSQGHQASGSEEEYFKGLYDIWACRPYLGHVTRTICINFGLPIVRSLYMKFELNWPKVSEKTMV